MTRVYSLMPACVAVCCSVLQCVAVRCSVLQCVAVCCSVSQCVAVSWHAWDDAYRRGASHTIPTVSHWTLQHSATHSNTLQHTATHCNTLQHTAHDTLSVTQDQRLLQCGAVCCNVLQCVAVCCSVLQCVAMCYWKCHARPTRLGFSRGCNSQHTQATTRHAGSIPFCCISRKWEVKALK